MNAIRACARDTNVVGCRLHLGSITTDERSKQGSQHAYLCSSYERYRTPAVHEISCPSYSVSEGPSLSTIYSGSVNLCAARVQENVTMSPAHLASWCSCTLAYLHHTNTSTHMFVQTHITINITALFGWQPRAHVSNTRCRLDEKQVSQTSAVC